MNRLAPVVWMLTMLAALPGCELPPAASPGLGAATPGGAATPPDAGADADRAAIRALSGVFEVSYDARETVALMPGYRVGPGHRAEAREAVLLVEDTPDRLTLEHLLLVGDPPAIAKHWRQTWTHQPGSRLGYDGNHTWSRELFLTPQAGAWAVQVAEADERPSYEIVGRWRHSDAGLSTFTELRPSDRPVSARDGASPDAAALTALTRIDVSPAGWAWTTDGQSRSDQGPLARILAVATYREASPDPAPGNTSGDSAGSSSGGSDGSASASSDTAVAADVDASAAAQSWWQSRGAFWDAVRAAWHDRAAAPRYAVAPDVSGEPLWEALFALEDAARRGTIPRDPAALRGAIDALLDRYVSVP